MESLSNNKNKLTSVIGPANKVSIYGASISAELLSNVIDDSKINSALDSEWNTFSTDEYIESKASRRMYVRIKAEINPPKNLLTSYRTFNVLKIAASITIFALCSALALYFISPEIFQFNGEKIAVYAGVGEVKKILLPDGSEVWLNAESEISYYSKFSDRKVSLKGQAYFKVKSAAGKTFQVSTDTINVTVLGTSFSVSAYTHEAVEVNVAEGKVNVELEINTNAKPHVLTAGQGLKYLTSNEFSRVYSVDSESLELWTTNVLVFDGKTLEEIADILEHKFGKKITITSEVLLKCGLYGKHKSDNLEPILKTIEFVFGCTYEITETEVILSGGGC
jgi:transmembrane sensor